MANFQTHLAVGTITSSLGATTILALELVSAGQIPALWLLGILGSLLPDIDSDDSTALRLIFKLFAISCALIGAILLYPLLSLVSLWLAAAAIFLIIRYALMPLFELLTVHRGTLHSLLAIILFALVTVQLSTYLGYSTVYAWCSGIMLGCGFITHLLLDEAYSVNLADMELKQSFGSAIKPVDLDYPLTSIAQLIICTVLIYYAPPLQPLIDAVSVSKLNFLPQQDFINFYYWLNNNQVL